jgi:Zn-finger protein
MVLVLYPSCHEEDKERQVDGNGWLCKAKELIDKGEKVKDVAKRIQEEYGIPKNKVKKELLHMNTEERR